jgi:hypothetical protein
VHDGSRETAIWETFGIHAVAIEALFTIIGLYLPLARNVVLRVTAGGASLAWTVRLYTGGMAGEVATNAFPTISISESPGIHSTAMQARDGALPGLK